ncbi:uncharacterized protein GIQ15_04037 [Arthroderma uncinatum]|uniref:uncharacterized protein n=1 Tax=Arthroderma uncinatum TaxID=74035 RepID=UPI00144A746D|nr:uncharacterized protein GIQ15_04037 [Arthroderma uncinatum]KAF3481278.1 hypothetical protein GIQ15_04037 [Arthroderma uncinatum]
MLDSSETPPPLHFSPPSSDQDRTSTRESTPIGTPLGLTSSNPRRPDLLHNHHLVHRKATAPSSFSPSTAHIPVFDDEDEDDSIFPLFPSSPPDQHHSSRRRHHRYNSSQHSITMDNRAMPIDLSSRQTSKSPPGQQASNLTSALQKAATGAADMSSNWNGVASNAYMTNAARKESFSATMAQYSNGSKPITVVGSNRDKPRRESLAGSLVGGMSWGGVSVGSWIRDDIIMTGTSPFTLQSPSYHSSSYLPKLEANFMRDFSCCGITLPSLHDLLQHYEEAHAQRSPQPPQRSAQANQTTSSDSRTMPGGSPHPSQQSQQQSSMGTAPGRAVSSTPGTPRPHHRLPQQPQQPLMQTTTGFGQSQSNDLPDIDSVDDMDMEMDDPLSDGGFQQQSHQQSLAQARFAQENGGSRVTPLNMGMLQGQQRFRSSAPGTPVSPGRPLHNNPTVSSVNTPTLMPLPVQQQQQQQQQNSQYRSTPESSAPGTPAELDESIVGGFGDMSMQGAATPGSGAGQQQFVAFGGNGMLDLCIDEPAKRLFRPNGGFGNGKTAQQAPPFRLGTSHYGANSDIAQHIREQQKLAGVPDVAITMKPDDEPKPFRCPVIGCEKAYKNQNGLKYHKSHGHNNQQLHDNADGTFSIVDPETSAPYPGTLGMEKEKPYRCEVCGKRYKNLNGLKYHRAHSPPCNPEFSFATAAGRPFNTPGGVMHGENINIAGAGLTGIGEEGL